MERISCGMIQDLLLSYRDGLTGDEVTQMIREHLDECSECQQRYENIKQQYELTDATEVARSNQFGNKLKSIRYYIIGFLIGLMLPILGIFAWLCFMALIP